MKKLNKTQRAEFEEHQAAIVKAINMLQETIDEFTQKRSELFVPVEEAFENASAVVDSFNEFRDDIATQLNDYADERSETWQESENGERYREWIDQWEAELDVDISFPDLADVEYELEEIHEEDYPIEPD